MKPVRSLKNHYRGINAHLHSFWQGARRWNRFHNVHIADLMKLMRAQLLPMGYTADIEESLQVRRVGEQGSRPQADVLVSDLDSARVRQPSLLSSPGAQVMVLEDLLEDEIDLEHPYYAVVIYPREQPGEPVAWIELLSPSNKGGRLDAHTYLAKRRELLRGGLVFVELDYLNETPSAFDRLPDYTRGEAGSHPYRLVVLDPYPDFSKGPAYLHEFDVDQPIPTVKIPLRGDDVLEFDFDAAYQKTFEEGLYGYDGDLDYRQLPLNFDRYSQADRTRIVARMLAVLKAAHEGIDLDANAPLPVEPVTLEDGLKQLETIQT